MRHESFGSGNIFSIFALVHIYTPVSSTIFMKPDPSKTMHYKKQSEEKSKLKQQCGIILGFINPLHMTTPWIYYCNA